MRFLVTAKCVDVPACKVYAPRRVPPLPPYAIT